MKIPAIITNLSSNEVAQEGIALYEKGAVLEIKTTTRGAIVRFHGSVSLINPKSSA